MEYQGIVGIKKQTNKTPRQIREVFTDNQHVLANL